MEGVGSRPGLLEVAVTLRVWTWLEAPELIPERLTVCGPAFSSIVRLLIGYGGGEELTGLTVTVKERTTVLLLKPPLLTVTAIVAEPEAKARSEERRVGEEWGWG